MAELGATAVPQAESEPETAVELPPLFDVAALAALEPELSAARALITKVEAKAAVIVEGALASKDVALVAEALHRYTEWGGLVAARWVTWLNAAAESLFPEEEEKEVGGAAVAGGALSKLCRHCDRPCNGLCLARYM
jgi:hypothetical protein